MIETFTALLIAHVLADFVLQTAWMVRRKCRPEVLALHGAIVILTALALLGPGAWAELALLGAVHMGIDLIKLGSRAAGVGAFLADQGAHLASLAAIAAVVPGLWAAGPWAQLAAPVPELILHAGLFATGFIAATRAGGFAVGTLMSAPGWTPPPDGLPDGGRIIGLLERGVIFLLIVARQYEAIGFLIAAKSILRFSTVSDNRAVSEYVIIGTLASFGWAIAVTFAMLTLQAALPALVIPGPAP
jgi:hypothetical protein